MLLVHGTSAGAAILIVENTEDSGAGSLRQAILTANLLPGVDRIHFNIPGSGPHIIRPLTELPIIIDPLTIDGTTQPGFAGTPIVALDGEQATPVQGGVIAGLRIVSGNSTVRGLMIYGWGSLIFWGTGISITALGSNVVEGNYIGLHSFGFQYAGNSVAIECLESSHNRIGGPDPTNRNVISYNFYGVLITNSPSALSSNNLVQGNFIGTDATGSLPSPNIGDAILISGGQRNQLVQNTIAFNHSQAIRLTNDGYGNTLSQNLIYSNASLGINLQPPGEPNDSVTPNDADDSDIGPNGLQNFPAITGLRVAGDSTVITGDLQSHPNRGYRVEFYRSTQIDTSGYGEGQFYLGSTSLVTGATGNAFFEFTAAGNFPDHYYTATATDQESGDTSEFSQAVRQPQMAIAVNGSDVQLSFHTLAGRIYSLEAIPQLNDPKGWRPLPEAENLSGTGELVTFHDSMSPQEPRRCYRLRMIP